MRRNLGILLALAALCATACTLDTQGRGWPDAGGGIEPPAPDAGQAPDAAKPDEPTPDPDPVVDAGAPEPPQDAGPQAGSDAPIGGAGGMGGAGGSAPQAGTVSIAGMGGMAGAAGAAGGAGAAGAIAPNRLPTIKFDGTKNNATLNAGGELKIDLDVKDDRPGVRVLVVISTALAPMEPTAFDQVFPAWADAKSTTTYGVLLLAQVTATVTVTDADGAVVTATRKYTARGLTLVVSVDVKTHAF